MPGPPVGDEPAPHTGAGSGPARSCSGDRGQATVEVALLIPLLATLAMVVVQVGLVVRDQVLVVHAARAAARAAAVGEPAGDAARVAADDLDPARVSVRLGRRGSNVTATVRYRSPTEVPIVGALVGDVDLEASVTMRRELQGAP